MIYDPRSDLRQLPSGRGWQKNGAGAQGTCKSFVSGPPIQGPPIPNTTVPGKVCAQAETTQTGGIELEPSFTCERLPCGLIFHGPAQKLLRFTELLAWPQNRLRPASLASCQWAARHEQAFCNVVTTVSPLVKGQMTLRRKSMPAKLESETEQAFFRLAAGKSGGSEGTRLRQGERQRERDIALLFPLPESNETKYCVFVWNGHHLQSIRIRLALWEAGFPTTNSDRCPLAGAIATCRTRRLSQLSTKAAFCIVLISVWSNCTLGIGFDAKQTRRPGCAGSYSSCQSSLAASPQDATIHQGLIRRGRCFAGPLWPGRSLSCGRSWRRQIALKFTSAHLRPEPPRIKVWRY